MDIVVGILTIVAIIAGFSLVGFLVLVGVAALNGN
jgi:hypothetical protein